MYRTPHNTNQPSVAPDIFWNHQPQQQQPPVPPPTGSSQQSAHPPPSWPNGFMATPGALPLIPPYLLPGRPGPFQHNSFASHYTPSGSFPSHPSYPMNIQSNFQSMPTFPLNSHFIPAPQPAASYHVPQPLPPGYFPFMPPPVVNNQNPQQQHQQKHFRSTNNNNNNHNNVNNTIPSTYNFYPFPTSFSSHSSSTPSTTSITELTGWSTWTSWLRGVKSVATIHGVLPHILDDPPVASANPMRRASYPPVMDEWSTPQDWEIHVAWQKQDAIMMHILTSQLSEDVSTVVPMVDDMEDSDVLFTTQDMLARL